MDASKIGQLYSGVALKESDEGRILTVNTASSRQKNGPRIEEIDSWAVANDLTKVFRK